jgi:carbon storage regulator
MLVLTRRVGEEIVIDGDIRITVTGVQGERVRIGVTAPASVRVDRREVHSRRSEFAAEPHLALAVIH